MTARSSPPPTIGGLTFIRLLSSSGGYGEVYLYREEQLGREVAVKVLRDRALDPVVRRRFESEATTMAGLQHPNVVAIHGIGVTTDNRAYIVMAYCPDQTMAQRAVGGGLSVPDVLQIGVDIGGAVESAHRAGIIHRDIKPANILTLPWGAPGLTDFGVAARLGPSAAQDDDVGVSIPWSPPEMLFTTTMGSAASDVYSLAATLWHLLVGRSPFEIPGGDNSRIAVMGRIRDLAPPPTGRSDVPASLERALARSMSKFPAQRHPSAEAFARSLGAVEAELHVRPTRLLIADQRRGPTTFGADPHAVGGRTRVRLTPPQHPPGRPDAAHSAGMQRATPLSSSPSATSGATASPSSRRRAGRLEATPAPRSVGAPTSSPSTEERTPASRTPASRGVLLAAGLVGAAVLGAGAYAVLGPDAAPASARSTVTASGAPDLGPGVGSPSPGSLPPGPVTVTADRVGGHVIYTWTYTEALATDSYVWKTDDDTDTTEDPTVTLAVPRGETRCLRVRVVRADGSNSLPTFSKPACSD